MAEGVLKVTVAKITGLPQSFGFGRNKVHVCVKCGVQTSHLDPREAQQQGVWLDQEATFQTKAEEEVVVELFERDTLCNDQFLGLARVPLWQVITEGHQTMLVPLKSSSGMAVGEVELRLSFTLSTSYPVSQGVAGGVRGGASGTASNHNPFGQTSGYSAYGTVNGNPASSAAYPAQPAPSAAYPAQPAPSAAYPAQPAPSAAYPAQPAPSAAYPAQPAPSVAYPAQPAPSAAYPAQPAPSVAYPAQPTPSAAYPGQPVMGYPGWGALPDVQAQPYPGMPGPMPSSQSNAYGYPPGGVPAYPSPSGPSPPYGQPSGAYGQPSGAYGQPSGAHGQPSGAHGQPSGAYGQPSGGYGQPSGGYGQPPGTPPSGYPTGGTAQSTYGTGSEGTTGVPSNSIPIEKPPPGYPMNTGSTAATQGYAPSNSMGGPYQKPGTFPQGPAYGPGVSAGGPGHMQVDPHKKKKKSSSSGLVTGLAAGVLGALALDAIFD